MNNSLTRSIGFWLLLVLSLASAAVGGWVISGQVSTMTSTLLDNTATGVDVYVGQSLIVVGSALLGAGVMGVLLTIALTAIKAMLPTPAPTVVESIDWTAQDDTTSKHDASAVETPDPTVADASEADDSQNGNSGSTATATKISVK